MIDQDGIERPDTPHEHMVENKIAPIDREITEDYRFVNKNILFRLWSRLLRRIGILIVGPYIKYRYKLKIVGKKNIKKVRKQGCMVTINHVHNFDNLLVGTKLLHHRKCYFITLKDNINMPFVGFLLRSLGGLPIPTSTKAMPAFEKSVNELLQKKKAILICPEASLWPYYRGVRPFKRGAFRFAIKNDVPILPVVISFRRRLKKNKKYKYYFTVQVGQPLYADSSLKNKNERISELQKRTYNFYKDTIESFYKEEEKIFQ